MKRAFIRLFGCVLSAIGLSMSYDTTFTMLLDDESAPGVARAAEAAPTGGTGTGCYFSEGCYVSGFNSGKSGLAPILVDVSGECSYGVYEGGHGLKVGYFVVLRPWYVGWINPDYSSASTLRAKWPVADGYVRTVELSFSGTSAQYDIDGRFAVTNEGTGGMYSSYGDAEIVDLCTGEYGANLGSSTGRGETAYINDWAHRRCIMNVDEVGQSNRTYDRYVFGAVYLPVAEPFDKYGCCSYGSGSSTTSGSGSGGSTSTTCPCYYAPATQAYSYKAYAKTDSSPSYSYRTTSTVPFYQPFVFYYYKGCKDGAYMTRAVTGLDANFAANLYTANANAVYGTYISGVCPSDPTVSALGLYTTEDGVTKYNNFWKDSCDICNEMTSVANSSSFSPAIKSIGTSTLKASSVVGRCEASAGGLTDALGTFNIIGNCYVDN